MKRYGSTPSTAPTIRMRKRSKDLSRPANWRTSSSCPTISTRWTRRRSRTSRLFARWWVGLRSIRRDIWWTAWDSMKKKSPRSLLTPCSFSGAVQGIMEGGSISAELMTKVISTAKASAQLDQLIRKANREKTRFIVGKPGEVAGVLVGMQDYL